ncbi:MAG TPA: hypothetical protein VE487_17055 [Ilumatobacter sp.]|nr:hypothetical protein [Ilumatobacter sp.]
MGWVVIGVIVALVGVAGWMFWSRSQTARAAASEPSPERASRVSDATPMTGLEVALDQVTDRSGRNMRDKIESGTAIDALIVPDDTGPILRRALDNVEHPEPVPHASASEPATRSATAEAAAGETSATEG